MTVLEQIKELELVSDEYFSLLQEAVITTNYRKVSDFISSLSAQDPQAQPYTGEKGTKYYKPFVQTVIPKIISAYERSLPNSWPEIKVTFSELDEIREQLRLTSYGSPQDVLYGFTSERYKDWGITLATLGFTSACMIGQAEMVVTMAPRYLDISTPNQVISEMSGAISKDFWESVDYVFNKDNFHDMLCDIKNNCGYDEDALDMAVCTDDTCNIIHDFLQRVLDDENSSECLRTKAKALMYLLEAAYTETNLQKRKSITKKLLKEPVSGLSVSQEQIALKYMEEGKYLQKILNGSRVEHLQSNVKMVKNPLRGNKCEVDSIYRVIGDKKFIFVEAKSRDKISRTQLYQLYETFRLRIPSDWEMSVVALLKSDATQEQKDKGVKNNIDLIEVYYDEARLGNITESLFAIKPKNHYRWEIL